MKFLNITNHQLSQEQKEDLRQNHRVTEFIELPENLKKKFGQIDPNKSTEDLENGVIGEISRFILETATRDGLVMIQGEFTVSFKLLEIVKNSTSLQPVVATSKREVVEIPLPEGGIKKVSKFKHIQFRYL